LFFEEEENRRKRTQRAQKVRKDSSTSKKFFNTLLKQIANYDKSISLICFFFVFFAFFCGYFLNLFYV